MKRKLIAVSMCLTAVLALGGCSNTGSNDGNTKNPSTSPSVSPSTSPSARPSPSPSAGINDHDIPNNAGGTANNGANGETNIGGTVDNGTTGGTVGNGTGDSGVAGSGVDDNGTAGNNGRSVPERNQNGNYSAGNDGAVYGDRSGTPRGLIRDAGDAVRDAADGVERAVRDIM